MNDTANSTGSTEEAFADDIGIVAFEGALVEYLASLDQSEQEAFEHYLEAQSGEDGFLDALCERYPVFEKLLMAEMRSIVDEFNVLTTESPEGNSQLTS